MAAPALTLSLAASSLTRPTVCAGAPRAVSARPRLALRVEVQSQSRGHAAAAASSLLDAPSAEEMAAPVATVHSPDEFQAILDANKDKMVVLMCKATHCRPCKLFAKKYAMAAMQYSDAVFTQIMGDENKANRSMMIENKVKVTPTFIIYRGGQKVHSHGGINETNLHRYISKYLQPGEAGYGTFVEPEEAAAAAAR
ncbi:hypothetical protein ABPG77_006877 [Micractinium sp. CCAP 211/92]